MTEAMVRVGALVLVLASPSGPAERATSTLECSYASRRVTSSHSKSYAEFGTQGLCARQTADGTVKIDPQHLKKLSFDKAGRAEIFVHQMGWVYAKPNGDTLPVMTYDNAPDQFSEGFVRGQRGGKVVYFGTDFKPAFSDRFDWGWPFEGGRALVCLGCTLEPDTTEEHRSLVGGRWGYIDHAGRPVVPITLTSDQIRKVQQR